MALIEEWRSLRLQRQHQTQERSAQVQATLTALNAQRQDKAQQVRKELNLYRTNLAKASAVRKANLQAYVLSLHQQIQDFLTLNAAERAIASEQLNKNLREFVTQLQAETQLLLTQYSQDRIQAQIQQREELTTFAETLRLDVQTYLQELQFMRQCRAQQNQQNLNQHRAKRLAEAEALSAQLSEFCRQLRQHSASIKSEVWGDGALHRSESNSHKDANRTQAQPQLNIPTPPAKPHVVVVKPAQTAVAVVPQTPAKPANFASILEEKVHNYIQQAPGSRLVEIESALGLNRVQTVDALSSLIQKGTITHRDRLYFPS